MSYILDALKKAESDRKLGSVPNIHTQAVAASEWERRASRWNAPWTWTVGALLASSLLAIVWYQPWRAAPAPLSSGTLSRPSLPAVAEPVLPQRSVTNATETTTTPTAVVAAQPQPSPPTVTEPVPVPVSVPVPTPPTTVATTSIGAAPQAAKPVQSRSGPALSAKTNHKAIEDGLPQPVPGAVAPLEKPLEKTVARPPESPRETSVLSEARVPNLRELPQNIQAEVPPLAITGYIYSKNAADRSVLINNKLLREGDQVAPGVVLEKITPKEAVLNYKGYRYRLSY